MFRTNTLFKGMDKDLREIISPIFEEKFPQRLHQYLGKYLDDRHQVSNALEPLMYEIESLIKQGYSLDRNQPVINHPGSHLFSFLMVRPAELVEKQKEELTQLCAKELLKEIEHEIVKQLEDAEREAAEAEAERARPEAEAEAAKDTTSIRARVAALLAGE